MFIELLTGYVMNQNGKIDIFLNLQSDWLPLKMKFIFITKLLAGPMHPWIKY